MINRLNASLVYLFLGFGEVFLAVRVVMRLFAANNANGFVHWIYTSTNILMEPFRGVFTTTSVGHDHTVDFAALFVMVVYGLVALAFLALSDYLATAGFEK